MTDHSGRLSRRSTAAIAALTLLVTVAVAVVAATSASAAKQTRFTFLTSSFAADLDHDGLPTIPQAQLFPNLYGQGLYFPTTLKNGVSIPNYRADPLKYAPRLIQSYRKKGLTWTFVLRKGVKGCTGNEMTADDVVYTFARIKTRTGVVNNSYTFWAGASVFNRADTSKELKGEVVKISKYVFRMRTSKETTLMPRAWADNSYATIYDSNLMRSKATQDDPWSHAWLRQGNAAGFGPYCLASIDPNAQEYRLQANRGSYIKPQFTSVIVRGVPNASTRLQAVRAGAADGTTDLSPAEYASLAKTQSVYTVADAQIIQLGLNFRIAPWSLPNNGLLRRAVATALDYKALIGGPLAGAATRLQGIVPPVYFGAATFPQPNQNIAKAKELLAQAGFPDGKGLERYKSGLVLHYSETNSAFAPALANQIRTSLAQIGIDVTLDQVPSSQFALRNFVRAELPMVIIVGNPGNTPEATAMGQLFLQSRATGGGGANYTNYANPVFDRAVVETQGLTGQAYTTAARKMQTTAWGDFPFVPVARLASQIVFKKGVSGWELRTITPVPTFWSLKTQ